MVGWIVAIGHELIAALSMLDEEHAIPVGFEQHGKHTNKYNWGSIGFHNVVVASLPKPYGKVSAATTAKEMSISHPHLRFGLFVGVGAGVPRPGYDVRLGDVVVSQPDGTTGGVVQYDLVKENGIRVELTGHLNSPSEVLQTAATSLSAQHMLSGSDMPAILQEALHKHPNLARSGSWVYQGFEQDHLYHETYYRVGTIAEIPTRKRQRIRSCVESECHLIPWFNLALLAQETP